MYRYFPKVSTQDYPDFVAGICYGVLQKDLKFGSNSSKNNHIRPALSLRKRDNFMIVLPMTSKKDSRFYHLSPEDCFSKKTDNIDSYVSFYDEILSDDSMDRCYKIGTLKEHSLRIKIADWLKSRI